MKLVIIDGQNGRMGALLTERVKAAGLPLETLVVGTNAIATAAMMKAGADRGATGENPVLVACRDADIIAGPIGILMADALMGEDYPRHRRGYRPEPRPEGAAASEQPLRQDRGGRPGADALPYYGRGRGGTAGAVCAAGHNAVRHLQYQKSGSEFYSDPLFKQQ